MTQHSRQPLLLIDAECTLITEGNYEKLAKPGIVKDRTMKNKKRGYYYLGITTKQVLRGKK
jgi:hypothetical protein